MQSPRIGNKHAQLYRARAYNCIGYISSCQSSFISAALSLSCSSSMVATSPIQHQYRHAVMDIDREKRERNEWFCRQWNETLLRRASSPSSRSFPGARLMASAFCYLRDNIGKAYRNEIGSSSKQYFSFPFHRYEWIRDKETLSHSAFVPSSVLSDNTCMKSKNDNSCRIQDSNFFSMGFMEKENSNYRVTLPPPDTNASHTKKNPSNPEEKKVVNKTGGDDDDDDRGNGSGGDGKKSPPESDSDEWALLMSLRFFLFIVTLSGVCWYWEQPKGKHVGWATLRKHLGEIEQINVYSSYAQVLVISPDGKEAHFYIGLVDESHTSARLDELRELYDKGRKQALKSSPTILLSEVKDPLPKTTEKEEEASTGSVKDHYSHSTKTTKNNSTNNNSTTTADSTKGNDYALFRHDSLPVVWKGNPISETCLRFLGMIAWFFPFIFLPAYVTVLSGAITRASLPMRRILQNGGAGGALDKAKSNFKVEPPSDTKFADVAGMKEAKTEIMEIVHFLRHPERYTHLGAKIPTGALLLGPPGTGKTLLAKAVSGESGISFIPVCGSDFIEKYVGMGAKRIRELFELAKKQRTIIYIDEIDAIGRKRQHEGSGEKHEQEHTLNELLTQLDGFFSKDHVGDIVVLASSNVALERLDPALTRPGRFDRIIHVDTPVRKEREEIFKVHLSKLKILPDKPTSSSSVDSTSSTSGGVPTPPEASSTSSKEEEEEITITAIPEVQMESATKKAKVTLIIPLPAGVTVTPTKFSTSTAQESKTVKEEVVVEKPSTDAPIASPERENAAPERAPPTPAPLSSCTALIPIAPVTAEEFMHNIVRDMKEKDLPLEHLTPVEAVLSVINQKPKEEQEIIDAYAARMSELCPGCVGADMANMCNEGAILAVQESASCVTIDHLERSIDRVLAGIEHRSRVLSDFEKKVVAHHEAGHAVAGWFLQRANPLMKVSIVPRSGSALGYAQYLPPENRNQTAKELKDSIAVTLGGRIAEQIFFQHLSTGASDDLDKVKHMAYFYVSSFQNAERGGGCYPPPDSEEMRYRKIYGEEKANAFDDQARQLVDQIYEETNQLLLKHKGHMSILAEHLLKEEVLTHVDVVRFLGVRPVRESDRKPLKDVLKIG